MLFLLVYIIIIVFTSDHERVVVYILEKPVPPLKQLFQF